MDDQKSSDPREIDGEYFIIQLFPIGHFKFPKFKLDEVLETLDTTAEAKQNFKSLFEYGVIPICNLFYSPIDMEGPQDGYGDYDLNFYKRIFKIRKYFFDNKFYRDFSF